MSIRMTRLLLAHCGWMTGHSEVIHMIARIVYVEK